MFSTLLSGAKLFLKSKTLKKVLSIIIPLIVGGIFLVMFLFIYVGGSLIESLTTFGNKEIQSQEENITGGIVQNPKSDYADNEVPKEFKDIYKKIADKYGIEWELLAGIHRVETGFSSNVATSSAGAIGHTQFMKCTWVGWSYKGCQGGLGDADIPDEILTDPEKIKEYGGQGVDGNGNGKADPYELSDSLSATAKKLKNDGANEDLDGAIFSYNQSDQYVSDVKKFYQNYKDDVKFVKAGIENADELGKSRSGKTSEIVGDMALPINKDTFLNKMSFGIGDYEGHPGYDFVTPIGTPVFSMTDGEVVDVQKGKPDKSPVSSGFTTNPSQNGLGNYVKVKPKDDPSVIISYFHLTQNNGVHVKKGDTVKKGQQIGLSGNSGQTTGPHLHVDMLKDGIYDIDHAVHWYPKFKKKVEAEG